MSFQSLKYNVFIYDFKELDQCREYGELEHP